MSRNYLILLMALYFGACNELDSLKIRNNPLDKKNNDCTPESTSCLGQEVWRCLETGDKMVLSETCNQGTTCLNGACNCVPASRSCQENEVWECNEAGTQSSLKETCPKETECTEGNCTCLARARFCKESEVWRCNKNGIGLASLGTCDESGYSCQQGVCCSAKCGCDMVYVRSAIGDYCIDKYEAARPDATASSAGTSNAHAVSAEGVIPWAAIRWAEAKSACEAAGKRLCGRDEFLTACQGPNEYSYPYGNEYSPTICNSKDANYGTAVPTGDMEGCEGGYKWIFDMSGNLMEWTADCETDLCHASGGSFFGYTGYLQCDYEYLISPVQNFDFLGFRCCKDI